MSILAIVGVIVSSAAMFVVLSGFSGLKDYSLEFISFVSPELKITSAKGKSFEFTEKIRSFLEDENISYSLSYEDKILFSMNENTRVFSFIEKRILSSYERLYEIFSSSKKDLIFSVNSKDFPFAEVIFSSGETKEINSRL